VQFYSYLSLQKVPIKEMEKLPLRTIAGWREQQEQLQRQNEESTAELGESSTPEGLLSPAVDATIAKAERLLMAPTTNDVTGLWFLADHVWEFFLSLQQNISWSLISLQRKTLRLDAEELFTVEPDAGGDQIYVRAEQLYVEAPPYFYSIQIVS